MRLRAGVRVLWRGPGEVQVGTDRRWALRLTALLPDEERALADLEAGKVLGTPPRVTPERWVELVEPLRSAGLVAGPGAVSAGPPVDVRVAVVGLGPLGALLAQGLAAAGVGLLLEDPHAIDAADVSPGSYRPTDVGRRREDLVARLVHDAGGRAPRVDGAARTDLVVLVGDGVADPARARALMAHGTPHLSVVVREADVVVGPLVVPGASACLRCLDLHRTDMDDRWPVVATQLATPAPYRRRATWPQVPRDVGPGTPAGTFAAAGIAVGQVLATLEWFGRAGSLAPATLDATIEVDAASGLPVARRWTMHPACGCGALEPLGLPAPASAGR